MRPQLGKLGWISELSLMFGSWPCSRAFKPCLVSQFHFPTPLPLSTSCFSKSNIIARFCSPIPTPGPCITPRHRVGLPAHPRGLPTPSLRHLSFYDLPFQMFLWLPAPPL